MTHINMREITVLLKKKYLIQVSKSSIYKLLAIISAFLIMPLLLEHLGEERYGIWITMYGLISWSLFFDFGIGNGLRNKLGIYLEKNMIKEALESISSSYIGIAVVCGIIYLTALSISPFVNWSNIFNSYTTPSHEIFISFIILLGLFLVNIVLSLVDPLFYSKHDASKASLRSLLSNVFSLVIVYVFKDIIKLENGIIYLAIIYGLSLIASSLILSLQFFRQNSHLYPKAYCFNKDIFSDLFDLGGKFFIIQLAVLIMFTTDKIIITQIVGPSSVVAYEAVYRVFSITLIINSLLLNPLWSSYTRAYTKGDHSLLRKTLIRSHIIIPLVLCIAFFIYLFTEHIVQLWMGSSITIPKYLPELMMTFVVCRIWSDIYSIFLNGISKITLQMWLTIFQAIINLPLSIYFCRIYGTPGALLGSLLTISLSVILLPLYSWHLIKNLDGHHNN